MIQKKNIFRLFFSESDLFSRRQNTSSPAKRDVEPTSLFNMQTKSFPFILSFKRAFGSLQLRGKSVGVLAARPSHCQGTNNTSKRTAKGHSEVHAVLRVNSRQRSPHGRQVETFLGFPYRDKTLLISTQLREKNCYTKCSACSHFPPHHHHRPGVSYLTWTRKLPCLYSFKPAVGCATLTDTCEREGESGGGERRGQSATEVNPVTHSACGSSRPGCLRGGER